jgi:hypothetical protein
VPVELLRPWHRRWLASRWLVLLSSARLGHTNQPYHGADGVPGCTVVDARHGGKALAAMALDAILDVVHCGRVLLALLALQESRGA